MNPNPDPLRIGPPMRPPLDPFNYGHSDLDPFGGGGGMILDPRGGRGAMGPRFDPVNPFNPDPASRGRGRGRGYGDDFGPPGFGGMFG